MSYEVIEIAGRPPRPLPLPLPLRGGLPHVFLWPRDLRGLVDGVAEQVADPAGADTADDRDPGDGKAESF